MSAARRNMKCAVLLNRPARPGASAEELMRHNLGHGLGTCGRLSAEDLDRDPTRLRCSTRWLSLSAPSGPPSRKLGGRLLAYRRRRAGSCSAVSLATASGPGRAYRCSERSEVWRLLAISSASPTSASARCVIAEWRS
jgi:hypothetical protein